MMLIREDVEFLGDTLRRIREFPQDAKKDAGREIVRLQEGREPLDWKPMPSIGKGVREIRVAERSGQFRVIYVANIGNKIYILHAFQKKTQKTPQRDLELAASRLKQIQRD
jgi:phage-related protein